MKTYLKTWGNYITALVTLSAVFGLLIGVWYHILNNTVVSSNTVFTIVAIILTLFVFVVITMTQWAKNILAVQKLKSYRYNP